MFQADLDPSERLLTIRYFGHVHAAEIDLCMARVRALTVHVEAGFCVLTDLSGLDEMDPECAARIGAIMSYLRERHLGKVVRVVPDPRKDIGFTLLSRFHYDGSVPMATFETLEEAMEFLAT